MRLLWTELFLSLGWLSVASSALSSFNEREVLPDFEAVLDTTRDLQRENDPECYDALIFSDVDFDRRVNSSEYLTFLQLVQPETDLEFESFSDLPLVLQSNFLILACLCLRDPFADDNCCVGDAAHISNLGAAPDETPTMEQIDYFNQVCFLTENSIDRYVAERPPTDAPTRRPTNAPTPRPTDRPTQTPTASPTVQPSNEPTGQPTEPPTVAPTVKVTPEPTMVPGETVAPSLSPRPTGSPTEAPTGTPTGTPTQEPSIAPVDITESPEVDVTSSPTALEADVIATSTYIISVPLALQPAEYRDELREAMDILAPIVAAELSPTGGPSGRTRLLRIEHRRRLAFIAVNLPTSVDGLIETVCPDTVSDNRRCEDVSASIGLTVSEGEISNIRVPDDFEVTDYEQALADAIEEGRLQEALLEVNPDTQVQILNAGDGGGGDDDDDDDDDGDGGGIGGGAVGGIVVAGVLSLLVGGLLISRGSRSNNESEEDFLKGEDESIDAGSEDDTQKAGKSGGGGGGNVVVQTPIMVPVSPGKADSDAGDSGWSSREGLSSLESSMDEETRASSTGAGESTVASSLVGSISQTPSQYSNPESEASVQMTYSELDQAIQKGDWAAVGVTAALLASQSYDDSEPKLDANKKVNFETSGRAEELDRLVEAGDWAGVVAAAAKYDAQENASASDGHSDTPRSPTGSVTSSQKSEGKTSSNASVASSAGSSGTGPSAFSGSGTAVTTGSGAFTSTGTAGSDTNSRVKKLDEIRAEVEQLVEKVVPEEKDNIDEMMTQFRGREEELVETLRSMQEREVAQKARLESQKQAKRDARQTVSSKYSEQQLTTGVATDDNWMMEIDNTPSQKDAAPAQESEKEVDTEESITVPHEGEDMDAEVLAIQHSLQAAIEAEDWDKVAETAASLSRRNVSSSQLDGGTSDVSTSTSDRSLEIGELVDRGDWDAVVAAATKYTETDHSTATSDSSLEERRIRRQKRLQEEQEALQQADIWNAIAEQTKTEATASESEANKAATVAADWAIARSLSELKAADKSGQLNDSDSGDDEANEKKGDDDNEEGTI